MPKTHPTLETLSFGCRLNIYETEVMRQAADAAGMTDALLVNTCAVTNEAERQARQAIRKAARENPNRPIVVSGCAAQLRPQEFAALPGVVKVLGNNEKLDPVHYRSDSGNIIVGDIMQVRETAGHLVSSFTSHARAFVEIQQGCDHRCTFCIIPFGRGNNRSVPAGHIINQIQTLIETGTKEVVLTGVDITGYGSDLPGRPRLGGLLKRLFRFLPNMPRLRLSSLDVAELEDDADFWDVLANEPRLMPHLHLSLQAGNDLILKRMKRRHSRAQAIAFCQKAKTIRPEVVFGADIIAGFPTETEEQFSDSATLLDECTIIYAHIFPFSARTGTPAAKMPQVRGDVRRERAGRLRTAATLQQQGFFKDQVGRFVEVLIEQNNTGHTPQFIPVTMMGATLASGTVARVRLDNLSGEIMIGSPAG
ncbi:MAG: tRNA (N(6)-L-threonylcarbamoyladenosine(37)-C(2))-methylthiotransferase MtaB [Holosporales bacterium]